MRSFFEFDFPTPIGQLGGIDSQPMWATAPARTPDGSVDYEGEHISVIPLALGRARIIRHHGYLLSDWSPEEGW